MVKALLEKGIFSLFVTEFVITFPVIEKGREGGWPWGYGAGRVGGAAMGEHVRLAALDGDSNDLGEKKCPIKFSLAEF